MDRDTMLYICQQCGEVISQLYYAQPDIDDFRSGDIIGDNAKRERSLYAQRCDHCGASQWRCLGKLNNDCWHDWAAVSGEMKRTSAPEAPADDKATIRLNKLRFAATLDPSVISFLPAQALTDALVLDLIQRFGAEPLKYIANPKPAWIEAAS